MRYILSIFLILLLLSGCSWFGPNKFDPSKPKPITIEKQKSYNIDLSKLKKIKSLDPIYVDENFNKISPDKAKYAILDLKEMKKVKVIIDLAKTYKDITKKQEVIINNKIDIINKYIEQLKLEREKTIEYRNLWVNAENRLREEKWNNEIQDLMDKAGIAGLIAAIIVISI